jgi:YHS domain-containing protein
VGRRVALQGGGEVTADAAYVRESIVAPDAKLVLGTALRMPSYEKDLTPGELDALVGYVETLVAAPAAPGAMGASAKQAARPAASAKPESTTTAAAATSAEPEKPAAPSIVAVDPVCSMNVKVVESTPRATHDGRTFFFCSEMCRERFVAEPARYAK